MTNLVTFEDYKVVLIPVNKELSTAWDSYSQIVDNLGDCRFFYYLAMTW